MLLKLTIENYALIRKLDIDLAGGFSVITGETGAGKSILVGALSLILGQRADSSVLFNKAAKCIVEGSFQLKNYGLEEFFVTNELDYDDVSILRREIAPNGKSRAFINDTPVNLSQLKALGDRLVNIHSQHSIITLNQANYQLEILDDYSNNQDTFLAYRKLYRDHQVMVHKLEKLKASEASMRNESDYLKFLFDELEKANLSNGEQEELEKQLALLSHAEEIKAGLSRSNMILDSTDSNVISMLTEVVASLKGIAGFHSPVADLVDRLETNLIDVKDITGELQRLNDDVYFDPQEIEEVSGRLDTIFRLQKKHQISTIGELIQLKEDLAARLVETESLDNVIDKLQQQTVTAGKKLFTLARKMSAIRVKAIPSFEKEILASLKELGMPSAQFQINCAQETTCSQDGIDRVKFLFSANKGVATNEVAKIASGGELSRLMLSIKSMISRKNLLPTIIFDEIDSGVSGDIAGKVGTILKRMSAPMQVIVITHLPQIAGKGDAHYWVFKEDDNETTCSKIRKLTMDERVEEIAKMVSSDRVTKASFQTAKELINNGT